MGMYVQLKHASTRVHDFDAEAKGSLIKADQVCACEYTCPFIYSQSMRVHVCMILMEVRKIHTNERSSKKTKVAKCVTAILIIIEGHEMAFNGF